MRNRQMFFAGAVLAAAMVVGCDKKEDSGMGTKAPAPVSNKMPDMANLKDKAGDMKDKAVTAGNDAVAQGKDMASDMTKQAQEKIAQIKEAISTGKLTDADAMLKQLDALKAKLPQSVQDQITDLRKQVDDGMSRLRNLGGLK